MQADPRPVTRPGLRAGVVAVFAVFVVVLVPWTVYLAISLPEEHVATNWDVVWTGIDVGLALLALATLAALLRRSAAVSALAAALAAVLLSDAWFDVTTAQPGDDRLAAVGTAVFFELPLAAFATWIAVRAHRLIGTEPHDPPSR